MKTSRLFLILVSTLLFIGTGSCKNVTPVTASLPRSTPEAEGVSSEAIITFLDSAARKQTGISQLHVSPSRQGNSRRMVGSLPAGPETYTLLDKQKLHLNGCWLCRYLKNF